MPTASVIEYIRRVAGPTGTDASLLDRFVRQGDGAAFAEIVQRHGPMVWGVCSRALPRTHDAEDAYQATFLVLARKAGSMSRPSLLANWLFGVARRVSLEARKRRVRIREQGMEGVDIAAPEPVSNDLQDVLDEEIGRLPERFRVPIVLCHLQGRTNAEAARLMACPEGTIASRLSTARNRLHGRLTRRGLASLLGGLATAASQSGVEATPPVAATASSTSLAQGVLTVMFIAKLKSVVIAASCVAFLGIAGVARLQVTAQSLAPPTRAPGDAATNQQAVPVPGGPSVPPAIPPGDAARNQQAVPVPGGPSVPPAIPPGYSTDGKDVPRKALGASSDLLKKRWDVAHEEFETRKGRDISDPNGRAKLFDAANRLFRAELDLATDRQSRQSAHVGHIDRLKTIERNIEQRVKAGQMTAVDQLEIESIRLEAEVRAQQEMIGLEAQRP